MFFGFVLDFLLFLIGFLWGVYNFWLFLWIYIYISYIWFFKLNTWRLVVVLSRGGLSNGEGGGLSRSSSLWFPIASPKVSLRKPYISPAKFLKKNLLGELGGAKRTNSCPLHHVFFFLRFAICPLLVGPPPLSWIGGSDVLARFFMHRIAWLIWHFLSCCFYFFLNKTIKTSHLIDSRNPQSSLLWNICRNFPNNVAIKEWKSCTHHFWVISTESAWSVCWCHKS